MGYSAPQTVYVRARATERWGRITPDIDPKLQAEIAGCIDICDHGDGTHTWCLMFAWPTHEHLQDAIAAGIAKLAKAATWATREALPVTSITVKESVPDTSKPPVDGVQPTKLVDVSRTVKEQAAKFRFVGEAVAVAEPVKEAEAAEGKLVK